MFTKNNIFSELLLFCWGATLRISCFKKKKKNQLLIHAMQVLTTYMCSRTFTCRFLPLTQIYAYTCGWTDQYELNSATKSHRRSDTSFSKLMDEGWRSWKQHTCGLLEFAGLALLFALVVNGLFNGASCNEANHGEILAIRFR